MEFNSGFNVFEKRGCQMLYESGDEILDELLAGGFHHELIYLLYGDKRIITDILLNTAVYSFKDENFEKKVAFVDGNNRFNPYYISKLAVRLNLSPTRVLEHFVIARAFTFEQMVELLEHKIKKLENLKIILISGITSLWPDYEKPTFEELLKAIHGIKKTILRSNPLIIMTAPLNEYSKIKPKGGKYLQHFGSVLILITDEERYIEYKLVQHPSMPENILKKWKPRDPKKKIPLKNTTLDEWI